MYNKLFTKILDSSIWLESDCTRLIWITLLATMDEDGFCQYASVANLAHRAVMAVEKAEEAVSILEAPDPNSSDPDHEGRRIERVPGGWMVLNSKKYRDLAKREIAREQTRLRVQEFRQRKSGNAPVTHHNQTVTPSYAVTSAVTGTNTKSEKSSAKTGTRIPENFKVTDGHRTWAIAHRMDDPDELIEGFRDYWKSKAGAGGRKLDWDATFRNWMRNAGLKKGNGNGVQRETKYGRTERAIREACDELAD